MDSYLYAEGGISTESTKIITEKQTQNISLSSILFYSYFLVSTLLILRFIFLNLLIFRKVISGEVINLGKGKIILNNDTHSPHSYLNYIFINKSDYNKGIEDGILQHEIAHVSQRHTLDILFIELLIALFWCNPALYFYRSAIRLNHEFLADRAVIKNSKDLPKYLDLVVNQIFHANRFHARKTLTSSFNYFKTKKRIIMMTKKYNKTSIQLKQLAIVPIIILAILLFGKTTLAQEGNENKKANNDAKSQEITPDQDLQLSFDEIMDKYVSVNEDGMLRVNMSMDKSDKEELKSIYLKMSAQQQAMQKIKFASRKYDKNTPSNENLDQWKDSDKYGVWIDSKRIENAELSKYSNADFSDFFVSKLAKNAKNYGKHTFQVDLTSNELFEKRNGSQSLIMMPNN
ncbi:M56 family metallopeptidase [Marivirga sp.]|uniref:M56 family metallopeptidase n=1 Tax=Marivirga sp. TaxID=2018662 RepID=UPI002D7E64A3|nr:M56 family metallopeptidase [Marivirga sp.]HET8861237.1 M56 family metallopeptidase [Marivirga sp.]